MKYYLVTGGAGFIGSHLAKKLLKDGNKVTIIDNLKTGFKNNIPSGSDFIEGSCGSIGTYKKLKLKKFDAIFHIAGQSSGEISFEDPIYDISSNTSSTILLLNYAIKTGCQRFIFASTMSVYGNKSRKPTKETDKTKPESFYGISKLASENYIRIFKRYGIDYTTLRLFNVYGPGQNMTNFRQGMVSIYMSQLIKNKKIIIKGSSQRYRDFIYIDDVVNYFIKCINNKKTIGKIINIGTGKKTYVHQIIKTLISLNKEKIPIEYTDPTPGDIYGIYANTRLMDKVFGKNKCTKINDGILKMFNHYTNKK